MVHRLAALGATNTEISRFVIVLAVAIYNQKSTCRSGLHAGRASALAEEALRLLSRQIGWDDYSRNGSDDAADEAHAAAVEDLRYSKPYRDDVDYDACHPSPSCPCVEAGSQCEAEDSEDDDYDCNGEGSSGRSGKD